MQKKLTEDFVIKAGTWVPDHFKERIAHLMGASIEFNRDGGNADAWFPAVTPTWRADTVYRVALTKPSINWKHVHPDYVQMATDASGRTYGYKAGELLKEATCWTHLNGGTSCILLKGFASLVPGTCDWQDSRVMRPVKEDKPCKD